MDRPIVLAPQGETGSSEFAWDGLGVSYLADEDALKKGGDHVVVSDGKDSSRLKYTVSTAREEIRGKDLPCEPAHETSGGALVATSLLRARSITRPIRWKKAEVYPRKVSKGAENAILLEFSQCSGPIVWNLASPFPEQGVTHHSKIGLSVQDLDRWQPSVFLALFPGHGYGRAAATPRFACMAPLPTPIRSESSWSLPTQTCRYPIAPVP